MSLRRIYRTPSLPQHTHIPILQMAEIAFLHLRHMLQGNTLGFIYILKDVFISMPERQCDTSNGGLPD